MCVCVCVCVAVTVGSDSEDDDNDDEDDDEECLKKIETIGVHEYVSACVHMYIHVGMFEQS